MMRRRAAKRQAGLLRLKYKMATLLVVSLRLLSKLKLLSAIFMRLANHFYLKTLINPAHTALNAWCSILLLGV
jgi:hypothetical protein